MINYNLFYKETLPIEKDWNFNPELFISAYNNSERVKTVYKKISAKNKHWIILPDYQNFKDDTDKDYIASQTSFSYDDSTSEADFVGGYFEWAKNINFENIDLCIDATGFVKPYLMTFIYYLVVIKKRSKINILFSEPQEYKEKHLTKFSIGDELVTRGIHGFSGVGHREDLEDVLVIGAGYDDKLISRAVDKNNSAEKKLQIFGFPSLRADMYQQNILRAHKASSTIGRGINFNSNLDLYAPANDPFATAQLLHNIYEKYNGNEKNWYLYPLATKAQMLGFVLFYLNECSNKAVTINYPFSKAHSVETSEGIVRIWKYTLEFPWRDRGL